MMTQDMRRPSPLFYAGWIVASAFSVVAAFWITFAVLALIIRVVGATIEVGGQKHITEDYLFMYILPPLVGLVTGILQALLLRPRLLHALWWIASTLAGWLVFTAVVPFAPLFPTDTPPALAGVLLGGTLGLLQWLVLRRWVAHAALWIVVSVCAWVAPFVSINGVISNATGALSVIALPPIITSLGLWLLFDRLARAPTPALPHD